MRAQHKDNLHFLILVYCTIHCEATEPQKELFNGHWIDEQSSQHIFCHGSRLCKSVIITVEDIGHTSKIKKNLENLLGNTKWFLIYVFPVTLDKFFFFINIGVWISLRAPQLISRTLKLTTM